MGRHRDGTRRAPSRGARPKRMANAARVSSARHAVRVFHRRCGESGRREIRVCQSGSPRRGRGLGSRSRCDMTRRRRACDPTRGGRRCSCAMPPRASAAALHGSRSRDSSRASPSGPGRRARSSPSGHSIRRRSMAVVSRCRSWRAASCPGASNPHDTIRATIASRSRNASRGWTRCRGTALWGWRLASEGDS